MVGVPFQRIPSRMGPGCATESPCTHRPIGNFRLLKASFDLTFLLFLEKLFPSLLLLASSQPPER